MSASPASRDCSDHRIATRTRFVLPVLAAMSAVLVSAEFVVVGLLPVLARDLNVPLQTAGLLVSAFALSAAVAGPILMLLGARWPPRAILTVGLLGFATATLVPVLAPSFDAMLVARIGQGAGLTLLISLASAMAASTARDGEAGRAVGQVTLGAVVGSVAAVPAGASLAELLGWRAVLAGLALLALVAAAAIFLVTPLGSSARTIRQSRPASLLRRPQFLAHLLLSGLLFTGMFTAYSYIAVVLEQAWSLSPRQVALALFFFGAMGLVGNGFAAAVVDRGPTLLTAVVALCVSAAIAAVSTTSAPGAAGLFLLALWGAGHTAAFVACQVRVMQAAYDAPALGASLNIAVCNIGIAAGGSLGGWLLASFGATALGWSAAAVGLGALAVSLPLRSP